jgi:hypothetical protein
LAGSLAGLFFLSLEGTMADPLSTSVNPVNDIQARQFISIFADATTAPVLTTPDLDTCLTYSRRQDANVNPPDPYVTWQAATAYAVGAAVVADPRNGSYFTATVAGTSAATQPTWPTTTNATVTDGGVTWKNAGAAAWGWSWSLSTGVRMGWEIKLGRLATVYDFKFGDQTLSRSQMFRNVRELIDFWGKKVPFQIKLQGSLRDRSYGQFQSNRSEDFLLDSWFWTTLFANYGGLYGNALGLGLNGFGHGFTGTSPGAQWIDQI